MQIKFIANNCQHGSISFSKPEGAAWLQEALPEIQEHNITWWPSVKTFEEWQSARLNELLARNE